MFDFRPAPKVCCWRYIGRRCTGMGGGGTTAEATAEAAEMLAKAAAEEEGGGLPPPTEGRGLIIAFP